MKKTIYIFIILILLFQANIILSKNKVIALNIDEISDAVNISSFLVNGKGEIFLYSNKTLKAFKFNKKGVFEKSFGRKGEGPGEFTRVLWMFFNRNTNDLYFPEYSSPGKGRVTIYDNDGKYKGELKLGLSKEYMDKISQIMVRKDNSFILVLRKRIGWKAIGKLFKTQSEVRVVHIAKDKKIKILYKKIIDGELTHKKGWGGPNILFKPRILVKLTADDLIAITSTEENKIKILNINGEIKKTIDLDIPKVKLTEKEFNSAKNNLINAFKGRGEPRMLYLAKNMIKLKYKPFYSNLFFAKNKIILSKPNRDKNGNFVWKTDLIFFNLQGKKESEEIVDGWVWNYKNEIILTQKNDEEDNEAFSVILM